MGRRAERLEETAEGIDGISTFPGDVSVADDVRAAIGAVIERHGGLDAVFHAAGIARRNEKLEETPEAQWRSDMAVNLDGAYHVCHFAIPPLRETRGAIVLVASQLSHVAAPGYASYATAKTGVLGLVRGLALDLGPSGVRVNALSPGVIDTDFAYVDRDFDAVRDQIATLIPLRRVGQVEDLTGAAVFLASDESSWMTGQSLVVDGGWTAQ